MNNADWLNATDPQAVQALLWASGKVSDRKLYLFATACLRRVWPLLDHEMTRLAVEVSEEYADGLISRNSLCEVWTNAELGTADGLWLDPDAAQDCDCDQCMEVVRVEEAAGVLRGVPEGTLDPAGFAARAAFQGRELVAWHAKSSHRSKAVEQEQRLQFNILLDILGSRSKPERIPPAWLLWNDSTVKRLAQAIYEQRLLPSGNLDNARLAVLADALEEAGCDNAKILAHCRNGGEHVRGCFVLDLLLGKR